MWAEPDPSGSGSRSLRSGASGVFVANFSVPRLPALLSAGSHCVPQPGLEPRVLLPLPAQVRITRTHQPPMPGCPLPSRCHLSAFL